VPGVTAGQLYAYRVAGAFDPAQGLRFDPNKVLLDPYGKCNAQPAERSREAARRPGDNAATALKSVVAEVGAYDWEGDEPLGRAFCKDGHLRDACRRVHPPPELGCRSGQAGRRGTYAGLIEKIPYLRDLGISAVELLPVFAFDEEDGPPGLGNYWGYRPLSFFAPHAGYSSRSEPLGALDEFRDMVKALHRARTRSSSMSSITTPRRAEPMVPQSVFEGWGTRLITFSQKTNLATPTTPAAETRSTQTNRSSGG